MFFASAIRPVWAAVLLFQLFSACSTRAQQSIQGKANTAPTAETAVKPTPQSVPQPRSPLSSSPQVILDQPVVGGKTPAASATWFADLAAAQAQAKATNRPLVVVFSGSDWCQPCVVFEQEVFSQPAFAAYAHNRLVLAHFDYPRKSQNQPTPAQAKLNQAAATQLNREGDFPLAVVVSPEGKVLAKTGYIPGGPAAFQTYLHKVLGK